MSGSSADMLETEIRELIVDSLKLEDIAAESIDVDEPLFDGSLGLDSIDALEIGIALRKRTVATPAPTFVAESMLGDWAGETICP